MNRLIIVGNGFDLAHGLPTSYGEFITDYFFEVMNIFFSERKYEDQLISITLKQSISFSSVPKFKSMKEIFHFLEQYSGYIELVFHSQLFRNLKDKLDSLNWVDVENEYFEELIKSKNRKDKFDYLVIKNLNSEFTYIKSLLEKYLSKVIKNSNQAINPNKFSRIFNDFIFKDEVLLKKLEENLLPKNIHILNFNYTSTVEVSVNDTIPTDVNYIHGMLNYKENPLIFGFGDEFDKNYKNFEEEKNNILFEHIKSFGYFKTGNYHDLIRFLESDDYQVYIIGHSCGLSDRTMLKEIFENEKCMSIKIFYYERADQTNDYIEKTMEISRHFENKGLMRKKIVPFPLSKKM